LTSASGAFFIKTRRFCFSHATSSPKPIAPIEKAKAEFPFLRCTSSIPIANLGINQFRAIKSD